MQVYEGLCVLIFEQAVFPPKHMFFFTILYAQSYCEKGNKELLLVCAPVTLKWGILRSQNQLISL